MREVKLEITDEGGVRVSLGSESIEYDKIDVLDRLHWSRDSKLSLRDCLEMRLRRGRGETARELSDAFGVSIRTVFRICHPDWKRV